MYTRYQCYSSTPKKNLRTPEQAPTNQKSLLCPLFQIFFKFTFCFI